MMVEMMVMVMVMDDGRDECDGGDAAAAVMIVLMNDGGHCTLVIPSPHSSAPLVFWVRSPVSL